MMVQRLLNTQTAAPGVRAGSAGRDRAGVCSSYGGGTTGNGQRSLDLGQETEVLRRSTIAQGRGCPAIARAGCASLLRSTVVETHHSLCRKRGTPDGRGRPTTAPASTPPTLPPVAATATVPPAPTTIPNSTTAPAVASSARMRSHQGRRVQHLTDPSAPAPETVAAQPMTDCQTGRAPPAPSSRIWPSSRCVGEATAHRCGTCRRP
jgi:hypothetical protein